MSLSYTRHEKIWTKTPETLVDDTDNENSCWQTIKFDTLAFLASNESSLQHCTQHFLLSTYQGTRRSWVW